MITKEDFKWNGIEIDGKAFSYSLATIYEMQMWQDIAKHARENPSLVKLRQGDKVVGKAIMISTLDEPNGNINFKSIWENSDKPSGLYRFFIPAYFNPNEDERKESEM